MLSIVLLYVQQNKKNMPYKFSRLGVITRRP